MKSAAIAALLWLLPLSLHAGAELLAYGRLPASVCDANGDTIGGIGSGITYDKAADRFICITDRGPGDGLIAYRPRFVVLKITPEAGHPRKLRVELVKSVLFRDENGQPFTGLQAAPWITDHPQNAGGRNCIDPEGVALAPDGTLYVSDEYGPDLYQFRQDGSLVRRICVGAHFTPVDQFGKTNFCDAAKIKSGREPNRGFEGLSILPSGKTAVLILQSPLVQDGGHKGRFTRIVLVDLASGNVTGEYEYPFEDIGVVNGKYGKSGGVIPVPPGGLGVNDITAIDDHRFLVLERDGLGENGALIAPRARYKSVWLADIRGASNLLDPCYAAYRTPKGQPGFRPLADATGVQPVRKTLLYNLPSLKFDFDANGPTAKTLGAKWEGLTIINRTRSGALDLIMTSDNDFLTPVIHDEGKSTLFPRARKPQDTFFLKIRTPIPE